MFYLRTKVRVQNSLYKLCMRPYLGGGGGVSSILFHQYDIVNIFED